MTHLLYALFHRSENGLLSQTKESFIVTPSAEDALRVLTHWNMLTSVWVYAPVLIRPSPDPKWLDGLQLVSIGGTPVYMPQPE